MSQDIKLTNRLSYKQAKLTVLIALALGLSFSVIQIIFDFKREQSRLDASVLELLDTVRGSAAQAAYGLEAPLAERVISGLFQHDAVVKAEISVDIGGNIASKDLTAMVQGQSRIADYLFNDKNEIYSIDLHIKLLPDPVGTLTVWVNRQLAFHDFFNRIYVILILGFMRSFILAAIIMAAFYYLMTNRLVIR